MALKKISLALLALSAKLASAQGISQEELDEHNRNADCANSCLFAAWPEGYCVDDPACSCNQKKNREEYHCCVAKECVTDFWKETLELDSDNCDAFGIPFTFDVEEACGFTPPTSSTSSEAMESSAETATRTSSDSSEAVESKTETVTVTSADPSEATESTSSALSQTEGTLTREFETPPASATASPTESKTEENNVETSSPPNGAVEGRVSWRVVAAVAGALMFL